MKTNETLDSLFGSSNSESHLLGSILLNSDTITKEQKSYYVQVFRDASMASDSDMFFSSGTAIDAMKNMTSILRKLETGTIKDRT